jgi:hypothetical protein
LEVSIDALIGPYKKKLYDDRVAMLPEGVQAVVLKPEKRRTAGEQKIADDYYPVLRIDAGKIMEVMPGPGRKRYQELLGRLDRAGDGRRRSPLPAFWTVEVDPKKATQKSYILTSGTPRGPRGPARSSPAGRSRRRRSISEMGGSKRFSDWADRPREPALARVAVNRLWQWHFGEVGEGLLGRNMW